ncbi:hypothetical protein Bca52824_011464 [Brassica carinata]|uniref:Uncharacterized protein n=1 Tax=Brassica carinata TaxID=52824 RepID=A0A8X7WFW7_BRACI|nr:hypothetical protein Bca52824_011464 [Brassica carinata]
MLMVLGWRVSPVSAPCARSFLSRRALTSPGVVARRTQGLVEEWSAFRVYGETAAVSFVERWSLSVAVVGLLVLAGVGEIQPFPSVIK